MKSRLTILIASTMVISITFISAADKRNEASSDCRNEKFATAEPGTCLDPKAYRLLKAINKFEKNPYNNDIAKRLIDVFEPRVRKTIDTIVHYSEYDVPVRIYYPTRKSVKNPTSVILFIHGGGFMFGSIDEYDMAVKKLAKVTEKIIVAVDYRLAPEHPFPAALNDVSAVAEWITTNMNKIGGRGKKIAVIGDSAGANLATVLALKYRNEGKEQIACQVLYYPPTTFEDKEFPSRIHFLRDEQRTYLLTEEFVRKSKKSYLNDSVDVKNPYVSPLNADFSWELPPLLIINAQVDPLRDDGRMYAEKLEKAGQNVTYIEYEGLIHGFLNFYMIFNEGVQSMKKVRDFVSVQFEDTPPEVSS